MVWLAFTHEFGDATKTINKEQILRAQGLQDFSDSLYRLLVLTFRTIAVVVKAVLIFIVAIAASVVDATK